MDVQAWVGPAIVAAVIAGVVNVLGWFVTQRHEVRAEATRRREKIRDCMTALRAEIRCHNFSLTEADTEYVAAICRQIEETTDFTPFIPREASNTVFATILPEIHILPGEVIDPIVRYYRQLDTVAQSIEDMRSPAFEKLNGARKSAIYRDYVALRTEGGRLAESASPLWKGCATCGEASVAGTRPGRSGDRRYRRQGQGSVCAHPHLPQSHKRSTCKRALSGISRMAGVHPRLAAAEGEASTANPSS